MRWITHQSFGLMSGLLIGLPVVSLPFVYLGSTIPDNIDFIRSGRNQSKFNQIHRGNSHFFGFYFLLCLAGLSSIEIGINYKNIELSTLFFSGIFGLGFGGLGHILLDFLNPSGVPYNPFRPKDRVGLGLISTHSFKEWIFLTALVIIFLLLKNIVYENYIGADIESYINKAINKLYRLF